MKCKKICCCFLACLLLVMGGCVDQSQKPEGDSALSESSEEGAALADRARVIATSPAVVAIMDKLDIDLVGVPSSDISTIPERYADVTVVGAAMSPDMEIVKSLSPDWVISPVTLASDLQPKYESIGVNSIFLNLKSVAGMYKSIEELGEKFGREEQANQLVKEFKEFYEEYSSNNEGKERPNVLILMGMPGSYVIATESSYVGSLVAMAGGVNVYQDEAEDFLTVNTEDMQQKDPDIILRCAHALPDEVLAMFSEEFSTNDIWKHFGAVTEEKVYDLSYEAFGMSANFNYSDALEELQPLLYDETE